MQDYKKLIVWKRAHELTFSIYKVSSKFPKEELYGLTSQMHRACISISSNIAEGCGKDGGAELSRFLQIALGSAFEIEDQLLLAKELSFLESHDYEKLGKQVIEVKKMLAALIEKIRS